MAGPGAWSRPELLRGPVGSSAFRGGSSSSGSDGAAVGHDAFLCFTGWFRFSAASRWPPYSLCCAWVGIPCHHNWAAALSQMSWMGSGWLQGWGTHIRCWRHVEQPAPRKGRIHRNW